MQRSGETSGSERQDDDALRAADTLIEYWPSPEEETSASDQRTVWTIVIVILKLAIALALSLAALLLGIFAAVAIHDLAAPVAGTSPGLADWAISVAAIAIPVCCIGLAGTVYFRSGRYWPVVLILVPTNLLMALLALFIIVGSI